MQRRTLLAAFALAIAGVIAPAPAPAAPSGRALFIHTDHEMHAAWKDENAATHKVVTTRRKFESTNNHAWRHYAAVEAMTAAFPPVSAADPYGGVQTIVTEWKVGVVTHKVVTPVDPDIPLEVTIKRHHKTVTALQQHYPPEGSLLATYVAFETGAGRIVNVPLAVVAEYGMRATAARLKSAV